MVKLMIMELVIATHNKDKFKELFLGLESLELKLRSLNDFPEIGEIIEDGDTLEENALIKARTVFKLTGLPSISDDTGLEVAALNCQPGIYTARYAGENCSYSDNVNKMMDEMKLVPWESRNAEFKTYMAYVDKHVELTACGVVKGKIDKKIKNVGGFGYDPIFYVSEYKRTFSEMSIEEKNKISHRGKAIKAIKLKLIKHLNQFKENA